MKANELRIGNLILLDGVNELYLDGIGEDEVHSSEGGYLEVERIEGIPLTEEWLLKFGFIKCLPGGSLFMLDGFSVYVFGSEGMYEGRNHIKIEYVHQLQNLYFALMDDELTLSEARQDKV